LLIQNGIYLDRKGVVKVSTTTSGSTRMSRIRISTMSVVAAVLVATTAFGTVAPAAQAAPKHGRAILAIL
jgi:hypothetical protein